MLRSTSALPPYAVEVHVTGKLDASRIPTLEIDAAYGPSKFDFNSATRVGCSLSSNVQNPVALSASQDGSKALIWELDAEKPCILSLRYFSLDGGTRSDGQETAVHLSFSAAVLPCISSCVTIEGSKIFCITADGALHVISPVKGNLQPDSSLAWRFSSSSSSSSVSDEAIQSISLTSTLERLGAPTALVCFQGTLCIGTSLGHILCLKADNPTLDSSFELDANAGLLNGFLSGFFNRGKPQNVEQLVELRFMDTSFLCSLHSGAVLRIWDLSTRKMVHSCDLIPPEEAATHKATLARVAVEPLDATCSILLIFFEPIDPSSSISGMLCTFELFLEDRGGGTIKVLMEGGPRLTSQSVHRLVDLAVQHTGVHSIGAWILYDDQDGRRKMHCVPLAFTDGEVKTTVEVLCIEEQIESVVPVNATEQQIEILSRLASTLESIMPGKSSINTTTTTATEKEVFNATDVFQDALFAPGHFCLPALQNAVEELQWSDFISFEDIMQLDIASLRSIFTQTVNTVAEQREQSHNQTQKILVWIEVINAYTRALRIYFAPRALVKLSVHRDEEQGLLIIRSSGSLSVVRGAKPQEIVAAKAWPPIWDKMRSSDSIGVKSILQAADILVDVCGGRFALMMIQRCLLQGADLRAHILPALLSWILNNGGNIFNSVPLKLGTLCSSPSTGFGASVEAVVTLLANDCVPPGGDSRSPLDVYSKPLVAACMARGHQTSAAQCECLLRVALLAAYVTSQHTLGTWTVPEQDRQLILGSVSDRVDWMLTAAGVAFWSTAAPIAKRKENTGMAGQDTMYGVVKPTASETANLVISLRIGDDENVGGGGGTGRGGGLNTTTASARKRARLTPSPTSSSFLTSDYAYPAEHLLSTFQSHAHAVRDLPDLQSVAASFSSWLLCLPKVHDIDLRRTDTPIINIALQKTVEVAPLLIKTHSAEALTELMTVMAHVHGYIDDPRIMFYAATSKALSLYSYLQNTSSTSSTNSRVIRQLERESVSLFFRVAATFTHPSFFLEKLKGVKTGLEDLLSSFNIKSSTVHVSSDILPSESQGVGTGTAAAAAEKLHYHESLMLFFEKLGCAHAASRFAMAAAQHVPDALPGENMAEERVRRTGRLWSSVFTFCLQSGEFEEAYSALLGNEIAEIQIDCVHQLVNKMAECGEIAALCALPFAHTSLVVRNGQPTWVSLLDEAVLALKKRAGRLELESDPQPYHVLFDFHVARGNYQAAASAMVSYARRLAVEAPEDRNAVEEAQRALAAAVATLGLVDSERAWLEDPSGILKPISSSLSSSTKNAAYGSSVPLTSTEERGIGGGEGANNDADDNVLWAPSILTLADLKIEHAIAVAKSSVAAVLPGGDIGTKTASEVFHQLLALKLHQEAFALADAAFVGTKQQRMREKAVVSLATTCAELQLQIGGSGSGSNYYSNTIDEGMMTDDLAPAENDEINGAALSLDDTTATDYAATAFGNISKSSTAASATWKRLRTHLETYEKQGASSHNTAGAMNLRVLAIDAILATNTALQPPLWLLAPFMPPPFEGLSLVSNAIMPIADVAGLLRAYLKHGRVEDAAILAVKVLSRVADSVPSVALPRPAAVCLPHALLEELATRVTSASPVKNDLSEKLNKAQAAAARQTQVLENIYAA